MYDVIIAGAGPAGTAAGYHLALQGLSVLLLDRRNFPRKKACAGGITPKAMDLFAYDISHLVRNTCREVKITQPGNTSFIIKNKDPLCYVTRRADLDAFSLEQALAVGCRFQKIDKITGLEQDGRGVDLNVVCGNQTQCLRGCFLIGADGANSRIRKLLVGSVSSIIKLPAMEADVRVGHDGQYPMEFDFSRDISGYYWIFPRKTHVNIGIFSAQPKIAISRGRLEEYAYARFGTRLLSDVKGYPISTSPGCTQLGKGRVLLVGDAAGLAEPLLGEGIYAALKSGILSGKAIERAFNGRKSHQSDALDWYCRALRPMALDLMLYRRCAHAMYRFPGLALSAASIGILHNCFSRGYSRGKTLHQILNPFSGA